MSTKSMDERVRVLESWAFQTGLDLAEIKAVQAEHTDRLTEVDDRLSRIEYGVGMLLDHYGIQRLQP